MAYARAQLNNLRIAPRKVRLVAGLIRKRKVSDALDQLSRMAKRSAMPVTKVLKSAVANAEHVLKLDAEHLWIREVRVDEGPKLKRFRPKGFGRPNPIEKKTSKVTIVVEHREDKHENKVTDNEKLKA